MKAYYFARNDNKLRYDDNREIVVGRMHTVKSKPVICKHGLHGSIKVMDALKYAPGPILYVVDITRNIDIGEDKICGKRRKYLAGFDATDMLREFAGKQALINIEKIKPYTDKYYLIVEYLSTGKSGLRAATEDAAWGAWSAASDAADKSAAEAARVAAEAASWSATEAASWVAVRSSNRSAAAEILEKMVKRVLNNVS